LLFSNPRSSTISLKHNHYVLNKKKRNGRKVI
jgi:hypothetical protein